MKWFIKGNVPSSKNGKRWTGKYLISSKTVMNYRKATKNLYIAYAIQFRAEFAKFKQPVHIKFTFIRNSKHKFDYINPTETTQDDMVEHGWITDDNADVIIPHFEEYRYDKQNPGVIIEILENENRRIES